MRDVPADAYSFRLKSRLAISLAWIAGFTNVVTLIAFGQVASHQTGNTTHVGLAVGQMMIGVPGAIRDKELTALFGNLKTWLPEDVGIFRLAHHKAGRLHKAPDFGGWADRIPHHWRVIILDNFVPDLEYAIARGMNLAQNLSEGMRTN
jgi:hypothetical protein